MLIKIVILMMKCYYQYVSVFKFIMITILSKIPLLKSLLKLRARQIYIVDTVEQCEQIAIKLEK